MYEYIVKGLLVSKALLMTKTMLPGSFPGYASAILLSECGRHVLAEQV